MTLSDSIGHPKQRRLAWIWGDTFRVLTAVLQCNKLHGMIHSTRTLLRTPLDGGPYRTFISLYHVFAI